jgi:mono/diheme cytochrome c family protein
LKKGRRKFAEPIAGLLIFQAVSGMLAPNVKGAEFDESKLPAAAPDKIEFARDIKPIFEKSCLRCHGPEKPKSGFRLDNRVAALKGGDDGVDILLGNSAKSPLVNYVARLVPDMEMPPEGRGEPLTTNQIAVLRAWIDQGAAWDNDIPTKLFDLTLAPTLGYTFTSGDKHKFREHYWRQDGIDGGLERSELFQQIDPETTLTVAGQSRLNDYAVSLELRRNELGFIRSGWEQHRKYYDGFGGYEGGSTPHLPPAIDEDLHLDYGRAWIDFGLTLPHWPQLVLGYEYDYKHGTEAITSWQSDQVPGDSRNIAPATKHLQEGTHIIKFDFDAELKGIAIEDRFRGEFYNLNSHYTNLASRNNFSQNVSSRDSYFEGANSIRLEKKFTSWWYGSGGYFYSKLNANDSFSDITAANNIAYIASVPRIDLERESHVFNLNSLFGPFSGLTLSAGVQGEWTRQTGVGSGNLNGITYQPTRDFPIHPATLASDYDKNTISESLGLRYTKIPFTTLFADGRFQQEKIAQTDSDIQPAPALSFAEDTTYTSRLYDARAGLSTSPWQSVSFSAHYRRYEDDSRYKTNEVAQPVGGYPGFISWRDLLTDEAEAKLSLRPVTWLKTMFTYQFVTTDYKQDTRTAFTLVPPATYSPGGFLLAGKYNSHIYSVGATITPFQRLVLCGTFSYQDSKTATDSSGLIPPYKGDVYSALLSGTYILDQTTDLALSYSFSRGDYWDDRTITPTTPLPLGIKYQQHALQAALIRRISKHLTTRLQYGFYYYDEPSLAGADNYRAHTVLATLVYHFH